MRWLPRTPRGTWLLTGVVWAAGSAVLWWVLPLRPRAEWAVGPQQIWVGFIPDRQAFVTYPFVTEGLYHGPLCFWEADSGRLIEWFDPEECIEPEVALSP